MDAGGRGMTIGNVEHKCANCVHWGCSFYTPFDHCMLHEGDYTSDDCCDDFNTIKFKDLIPASKDVIHRYLDKLKEEELITSYEINTIYTDDEPYCTDITLYKGKHVYAHMFSDLNDKNLVIETLAECVIKLYREMANDLMKEIKEYKE